MPFRDSKDIQLALDMLTLIDERELRRNRRIPSLYKSGVRWKRDVCPAPVARVAGACERFVSVTLVLEAGYGDCDDLAPWRAAELRVQYERTGGRQGDSKAMAFPIRSPGIGWHILVRRSDGSTEDPSKVLGMKGAA
jgi:hypothetical protein